MFGAITHQFWLAYSSKPKIENLSKYMEGKRASKRKKEYKKKNKVEFSRLIFSTVRRSGWHFGSTFYITIAKSFDL